MRTSVPIRVCLTVEPTSTMQQELTALAEASLVLDHDQGHAFLVMSVPMTALRRLNQDKVVGCQKW